jgi:hypothetical protein
VVKGSAIFDPDRSRHRSLFKSMPRACQDLMTDPYFLFLFLFLLSGGKALTPFSFQAAIDRWYGWKSQREENWKASSDYRQAHSLALELSGGDAQSAELLLAWLQRRAELIVEKQWPNIQRLSAALVERGKIKGTEIRHIMQGV